MSWYMRPSSEVEEETFADMRRMGRKTFEWLYREDDEHQEFSCGCQILPQEIDELVHLCDYHNGFDEGIKRLRQQQRSKN
jgi:hypothetical protein